MVCHEKWIGFDFFASIGTDLGFDIIGPVEVAIHSIVVDDVSVELGRLVHVESLPLASCFNCSDILLELSNVFSNWD